MVGPLWLQVPTTGPHVENLEQWKTNSFDRRIQVTMVAINQITWISLWTFVPLWLEDETRKMRPGLVFVEG